MAKKSANPADAFRKAQRAKELKKNKDERKKKRDEKTVKRDTRDLEGEIKALKARGTLDDEGKARLASLESELKYVSRLKDKYVKAHPEAADRVYNAEKRDRGDRAGNWRGPEDEADAEGSAAPAQDPRAHLYHADGTLRDPKRSAYYHATYNPFGVPPPGMPYKERGEWRAGMDLTPDDLSDESSDDSDDDDDSDSDIVMPEGPRPDESDADSDDSDDIPLPAGPPPPKLPPPPGGPPPFGAPPPFGRPPPFGAPPFPAPPFARPPRPAFNPVTAPGVGWGHLMDAPVPPRRQNGGAAAGGAGGSRLPAAPASLPPKPGAVVAAAATSVASKPGPSSSTFSAPAAASSTIATTTAAAAPVAATISAAPQLRDLRKETTVFVPRGVKRKPAGVPNVNATPGAGHVDADGDVVRARNTDSGPGLLSKLQAVGVAPARAAAGGRAAPAGSAAGGGPGTEAEDDYEKFLSGLE
ncbi:hypothetical protein Q8F55_002510 [Vanrija albida]|uniref:Wbp11/ELF5/Saf1 N-terminal domain-containing protein n=1 Tax=Vanrija albida TaxID=181172 RepID=A0ABR3QA04_9TREE